MKNILLIGCGHMGHALLKSWIKTDTYLLTVIDPIQYKSLNIKYKNKKISFYKNFKSLKKTFNFDALILATKPIDLETVLEELSNFQIKDKTSIISVVAGKKINLLKKHFNKIKNIFRIMPNMPASIGESMNCMVSNNGASKVKVNQVRKLFSHTGKTILLQNENQIDMATAVSGSGPGFVFNLIDAMEKGAKKLGFNEEIAKTLVIETFRGSVNLISSNKLSAEKLVNYVATKGGTTEAGLRVMKRNNIHKVFQEVFKKSYLKARQQGKKNVAK